MALASIALAIGCASAPSRPPSVIESLVSESVVEAAFQPPIDLRWQVEHRDDVQSFSAEYPFEPREPGQHFTIEVAVAPAGRFLKPERAPAGQPAVPDAEAEAEAVAAATSAPVPDAHADPVVGLRSRKQILGFGPGGAAYAFTFTTRDAKYDVRITVSSLLPEHVPEPKFSIEQFAQVLEQRYEAHARSERR